LRDELLAQLGDLALVQRARPAEVGYLFQLVGLPFLERLRLPLEDDEAAAGRAPAVVRPTLLDDLVGVVPELPALRRREVRALHVLQRLLHPVTRGWFRAHAAPSRGQQGVGTHCFSNAMSSGAWAVVSICRTCSQAGFRRGWRSAKSRLLGMNPDAAATFVSPTPFFLLGVEPVSSALFGRCRVRLS
jgi:hypothetical protein